MQMLITVGEKSPSENMCIIYSQQKRDGILTVHERWNLVTTAAASF